MISRKITATTAALAALLALPLAAQTTQCTFTTECFESEICTDTSFSMAIEQTEGKTALVSDAETVTASVGGSDTVRVYVGVTDSAFHLMSRAADGTARYSTHLYEGPMVVSYLGNCEGAD